ncbi:alpha/beta hydrolase [Streptomyces sp. NPDC052101]|uniref:alpha/beta hydrolase n=1 Tax=Streptomyces sp. NPDC052101 TaxID=3155763 RepID=UPI003418818B
MTSRMRTPRPAMTGRSLNQKVVALKARAIGTAVLVTAMLTVSAATAAAADTVAAARNPASSLNWTACPFPDSPAELQCASIQVPVDYAHPHGLKATITVDRLRASGAHPVGSLFFDPGGPGGSGTQFVQAESLGAHVFSAATREHFDVIGLDPRGVGLSSPVRCDPALLNRQVSLFPKDEAGFRHLVARNKALGRSCRRLTGPLLEHVDTVSAARDLEALRQALGEGKLNYLGLSYGSQLGATYAELFPNRIRTLALDGALDHSLSTVPLFKDESHAYEDSLNRFFDWCAQTTSCALHGTEVGRLFDTLVAAADHRPIPAPTCAKAGDCRPFVTGEDIRFAAQGLLLFPSRRNDLALALQQAEAGDASALSQPVATGPSDDNANGSQIAIECLDWTTPIRTLHDLQNLRRLGQAVAPRLGGASQSWTILTGCVGWPARVANPPQPIKVQHAPTILITNATHDPSTAYPWALQLHHDLPSSVLVTRQGDGHTSYLAKGTSHTRDAIDSYLLTGRTPPPDTVYDD